LFSRQAHYDADDEGVDITVKSRWSYGTREVSLAAANNAYKGHSSTEFAHKVSEDEATAGLHSALRKVQSIDDFVGHYLASTTAGQSRLPCATPPSKAVIGRAASEFELADAPDASGEQASCALSMQVDLTDRHVLATPKKVQSCGSSAGHDRAETVVGSDLQEDEGKNPRRT